MSTKEKPYRTGRRRWIRDRWIWQLSDRTWEDENGMVFALADPALGMDSHTRAGVGIFSLPEDHFLSQAAKTHDYMFTSPKYQQAYTMAEANAKFLHDAAILSKGHRRARFWLWIARNALSMLGPLFWDNKETIRGRR
jgi:hypothetical protein